MCVCISQLLNYVENKKRKYTKVLSVYLWLMGLQFMFLCIKNLFSMSI